MPVLAQKAVRRAIVSIMVMSSVVVYAAASVAVCSNIFGRVE